MQMHCYRASTLKDKRLILKLSCEVSWPLGVDFLQGILFVVLLSCFGMYIVFYIGMLCWGAGERALDTCGSMCVSADADSCTGQLGLGMRMRGRESSSHVRSEPAALWQRWPSQLPRNPGFLFFAASLSLTGSELTWSCLHSRPAAKREKNVEEHTGGWVDSRKWEHTPKNTAPPMEGELTSPLQHKAQISGWP
jgi:hypothetical protein